ncbi:hypothetical protein KIN20_004942 [Parelaphostrongylus tenuis]|uniref:Protein kinase domain-containing protein n=1 Tax=Parelaphostrongylus tenuis TaxID=148309 RepID=A0AAD5LZ89_PARTN|nr:hypothetical protein KIN20_004942 [Parelaphostrongylus tenuis]
MEYLHKNKVIHRDLKSPNILFDEEGVVKICDFGTSHQQRKQNSTVMSFCGTVSWMAPEVIKKQPCCEKVGFYVDVYSYGVVLWELLTREQPYKNINQMAIIYGVGSNNLSLPIPDSTPDGLKMLMRQSMGSEEFLRRSAKWRADAANIQYPETITKANVHNFADREDEKELIRKRRQELKHAQDIREMYENKLKRTNKMYAKLTDCMNELLLKEKELEQRIRLWDETHRYASFNPTVTMRPTVVRAGPKTIRGSEQDIYCMAVDLHSYGMEESSSDEYLADYQRGSLYRCSQASSSSGFPSSNSATFSRQSSSRSSAGMSRRHDNTVREATISGYDPSFSRSTCMRHSLSSHSTVPNWCGIHQHELVVCLRTAVCKCGMSLQWSPVDISDDEQNARQLSTRDSPARVAQNRGKQHRSSYPSQMHYQSQVRIDTECCCDCINDNCCRLKRNGSSIRKHHRQSPTPYNNPTELNVSNLPTSSYQEPLNTAGNGSEMQSNIAENRLTDLVETSTSNVIRKISGQSLNIVAVSSLDPNNPTSNPRTQSDASSENSADDEKDEENGNTLESSLDSQKASSAMTKTSSEDDSAENGMAFSR